MEQVIKDKTEEMVNQTRQKMNANGRIMGQSEELFFRMGISHGIMIGGLSLVNTPADITMEGYDKQ